MQRLPDVCECVIRVVGNAFKRVSNHIFAIAEWTDLSCIGNFRFLSLNDQYSGD
jgi:hypothetical protein